MTAKEKANELLDKFLIEVRGADMYNYNLEDMNVFIAKGIALICINEIIDAIDWHEFETPNKEINFWLDVRKELNQM